MGVKEVAPQDIHKYGVVDGDKIAEGLYTVRSLVEKPKAEAAPSMWPLWAVISLRLLSSIFWKKQHRAQAMKFN